MLRLTAPYTIYCTSATTARVLKAHAKIFGFTFRCMFVFSPESFLSKEASTYFEDQVWWERSRRSGGKINVSYNICRLFHDLPL
jgi:hypothetical protein